MSFFGKCNYCSTLLNESTQPTRSQTTKADLYPNPLSFRIFSLIDIIIPAKAFYHPSVSPETEPIQRAAKIFGQIISDVIYLDIQE